MVSNYQEAKIQNREALRRGLLDAASRILVKDGPEGLNMRTVAKEVQASTKVLYTLFGSKEGLLEQLYREGFERLQTVLESVSAGAPLERLAQIGLIYRRFALENPNYYAILMNMNNASITQLPENIERAVNSFEVIGRTVQKCIEGGLMAGDPEQIAVSLWAAMHGVISLELSNHFYKYSIEWRDQLFESTVRSNIRGFLTAQELLKPLSENENDREKLSGESTKE